MALIPETIIVSTKYTKFITEFLFTNYTTDDEIIIQHLSQHLFAGNDFITRCKTPTEDDKLIVQTMFMDKLKNYFEFEDEILDQLVNDMMQRKQETNSFALTITCLDLLKLFTSILKSFAKKIPNLALASNIDNLDFAEIMWRTKSLLLDCHCTDVICLSCFQKQITGV